MIEWQVVVYSEQAELDLRSIYEYINFSLLAPEVAKKQTRRILEGIASLNQLALRHQLYEKEPCNLTDKKFLGNPTRSYRTRHSLSVVGNSWIGRDMPIGSSENAGSRRRGAYWIFKEENMKEIQFSIEIHASKERVWATLWEDVTFRDWASIIDEGTYMRSNERRK